MPSQICQGKRLWDLSVFTSHKSFTFWFPTLQECLMGGFLSCSKWVECECSITPVFVPTRSRKPLTEIYEFKFNVDTRAIERAMFDQKVWFNPDCLWLLFLENGNSSNLVIWIIDKLILSCEYQLLQVTEKHNQYKLYREEYEAARKVW
jgi:hypothetical protein